MDVNKLASRIVRTSTNETTAKKNPAAVALGKLGGLKGGPARAEKLPPERRREIAIKGAETRWERLSLYNEVKATQTAALLLELNGGEMDYAKCTKLLYNIEREALNRWMRPVTFDNLCSLPHGQVLSKTLDKAKFENQHNKSFWRKHLETYNKNNIRLVKECGRGKLSRAEIELIKEFDNKYKDKTPGQMMDEHHNAKLFPEWKDPGRSSIKTTYPDLLRVLGKTPEQIKEFEQDLSALKHLKAITR
jgi:hypothetical protein